jgi:DTW domain-containing protein YfiP
MQSEIFISSEAPVSREMCYRCFWPRSICWCSSVHPIETRTKILILMHPREFKDTKAGTGRLTRICLKNSEIHMGIRFDTHAAVQERIHDSGYYPMLLYPGPDSVAISDQGLREMIVHDRSLLIILLDATWHNAKKMFEASPTLQKLPRLRIEPEEKSRYLIKKQPFDWCLSTIEATHELMKALDRSGLDTYERPGQMLNLFERLQKYQIDCMQNPGRQRYRPGLGQKLARRIAAHGYDRG